MSETGQGRAAWESLRQAVERSATVEAIFGYDGRKSGGRVRYFCPFHSRDDQSDCRDRRLSVNPKTLGWRCFDSGCGLSGNLWTFANGGLPARGDDFKRAVVAVADKLGVAVPDGLRAAASGAASGRASNPQPETSAESASGDPPERPQPPISAYEGGCAAERSAGDRPRAKPSQADGQAYARRLWAESVPIPLDAIHPARRWAGSFGAKWGVWSETRTWPSSVRWLPDRAASGAGALVAAVADLGAWLATWPKVPKPSGVHCVYVTATGRADTARGVKGKRSYGSLSGCGCLLSADDGSASRGPVYATEGIADGLACATWVLGPECQLARSQPYRGTARAFATCGTSGYMNPEIAAALAKVPEGVIVCADSDSAGKRSAAKLAVAIRTAGGTATVWRLGAGYDGRYDMADMAADMADEYAERAAIQAESGCDSGSEVK